MKLLLTILLFISVAAQSQMRGPRIVSSSPPPFSLTDIPDLVSWGSARQLTGLSDNDPITTIADQSSEGNDVTQGSSGQRPLYKTSQVNGLPAILFDGTDDFLSKASPSNMGGLSGMTIFIVLKPTSLSVNKCMLSYWTYATQGCWELGTYGGSADYPDMYLAGTLTDGGNNEFRAGGSVFSTSAFHLLTIVYDGSQGTAINRITFYLDGVSTGTSVTINGTPPTSLLSPSADLAIAKWPGLNRYWDGYMAEWAIYKRTLNGTELGNANSYLMTTYGL